MHQPAAHRIGDYTARAGAVSRPVARPLVGATSEPDSPAPQGRGASNRPPALVERGQADPRDALAREADLPRGAFGKIDSAAANVRATIVDSHHHRSPVVEVRYPHSRAHRQAARGCGQAIFPEDFAVAGAPSLEPWSVPRSNRQMTAPGRRGLIGFRPGPERCSHRLHRAARDHRASRCQCHHQRQPCVCFCLKHPAALWVPLLQDPPETGQLPGAARPDMRVRLSGLACSPMLAFQSPGRIIARR